MLFSLAFATALASEPVPHAEGEPQLLPESVHTETAGHTLPHEHPSGSLGIKWASFSMVAGDVPHRTYHGAGVFLEHQVTPHIAVELSIPLLYHPDAWLLPLDLVVKRTFMPVRHVGLGLEVSYAAAWEGIHGIAHEIGFGAGPIVHFQ